MVWEVNFRDVIYCLFWSADWFICLDITGTRLVYIVGICGNQLQIGFLWSSQVAYELEYY